MSLSPTSTDAPCPPPTRRRSVGRAGFTFIEVMFAVLVLAAGVVMVATLLPVGLRTAEQTRETTLGLASLESGFHTFRATLPDRLRDMPVSGFDGNADGDIADATDFAGVVTWPAADQGFIFNGPNAAQPTTAYDVRPLLSRSLGNRVSSADPRNMWVPFYYRPSIDAAPQVAMVSLRSRADQPYPAGSGSAFFSAFYDVFAGPGGVPTLDTPSSGTALYGNHPIPVSLATLGGVGVPAAGSGLVQLRPDVVRLSNRLLPNGSNQDATNNSFDQVQEAAVEGAAVVFPDNLGRLRVYQLGEPVENTNGVITYELLPAALDVSKFVNGGDDANADNDYFDDATATSRGFTLDDWEDVTGQSGAPTAFGDAGGELNPVPGYLIGRMLENPSGSVGDWDTTDNPHVGPSQVVGVLQGTTLR